MNKNINGALLGLLVGGFYFVFVFFMGMEASDFAFIIAAPLVTFAVITPLVLWMPLSRIWIYPLSFALPTLVIGLIALTGGVSTIIEIGAATFSVGLIAGLIAIKLKAIFLRKKLDV